MAKNDKKYRVGKSKIQGKGVFSKQDLKPGDYIGKAHTINKLYTDYDFTDLGKNHNHSDNPNVQNVLIGNERHFVATKPIKKGEELTTNYRLQPDLEQPEDFKKGGKMTPQEDGYRSYSPYKDLPYIEVDSNSIDTDGIVHDLLLVGDDGSQKFVEKNTGIHVLPDSERVTEYPVKAKTGRWLDVYNAPKAQNGIEGTMGGLTDKGFNYNPAWGGAWQNGGRLQPPMAGATQPLPLYQTGGSLPGATGMMYARTAGAAPSEGPYAKKTLPSAENGMSYYQAGLDFKPKTISRDGRSVNKADEYPLEKLDNLLNFTNYNKPKAKSGGWLDKYK